MERKGWIGGGADDGRSRGRGALLSAGIMARRDTHATRRRTVAGTSFAGGNEVADIENWLSRYLFSDFSVDRYTEAAGKVTQFPDNVALIGAAAPNARTIVPTHAFFQGSGALQVATPTPDAAINGQLSATFSAHRYDSSLISAPWLPFHMGDSVTASLIVPVGLPATGIIAETWFSGNGFLAAQGAGPGTLAVYRPTTGMSVLSDAGTYAIGTPRAVITTCTATDITIQRSGDPTISTLPVSGASSSVGQPVHIGARPPTVAPVNARIARIMFATFISAELIANMKRLFLLKYGVVWI